MAVFSLRASLRYFTPLAVIWFWISLKRKHFVSVQHTNYFISHARPELSLMSRSKAVSLQQEDSCDFHLWGGHTVLVRCLQMHFQKQSSEYQSLPSKLACGCILEILCWHCWHISAENSLLLVWDCNVGALWNRHTAQWNVSAAVHEEIKLFPSPFYLQGDGHQNFCCFYKRPQVSGPSGSQYFPKGMDYN